MFVLLRTFIHESRKRSRRRRELIELVNLNLEIGGEMKTFQQDEHLFQHFTLYNIKLTTVLYTITNNKPA